MVKKNATLPTFLVMGVFAAAILIGGTYVLGIQKDTNQTTPNTVLGTTTSSDTTKAAAVASAAYQKCIQNDGFVTTARRGTSGYYQVCNFADDMDCELYALYAGQCPVGGVHTIGYSTTDQVFCALRGGTPQGKNNGQCKMPDGVVCSTTQVYKNGTCSSN